MVSRVIPINRTPEGKPVMTAGGGSLHKTYESQTVLKRSPGGYELKEAIFIKTAGHLAGRPDQATIPLELNDVVVYLSGKLPISDLNPDCYISAWRITDIGLTIADGEQVQITHKEIPLKVITGTGIYHNRKGAYFCSNPIITTED
jgi:hypothetical protein